MATTPEAVATVIAALRDRVRGYLLESAMTPTERFELHAEQFYRETGYLAPGKSVPMAMAGAFSDEKRHAAWDEWNERRKRQWQQDMRDVLADLSVPSGGPQWQPIETAPKGDCVLFYDPSEEEPTDQIGVGYWHGSVQCWIWLADGCEAHPTYWMPLPSPPSDPETGEGQ